jgi:hypothetical protein
MRWSIGWSPARISMRAGRRHEMEDARDYGRRLGTPHEMTLAAITWLAAVERGDRTRES